jgi:hypothetical protein
MLQIELGASDILRGRGSRILPRADGQTMLGDGLGNSIVQPFNQQGAQHECRE